MISNSVTAMTVIDLLIILAVSVAAVLTMRSGALLTRAGRLAPALILLGLLLLGLFYFGDLLVMHVGPLIVGEARAMALMIELHLDLRWVVSLISLTLICAGYVLALRDRQVSEQALLKSEERYRAIVQDQTDAIVRWRPDGIRTWVNDRACEILGKPRDELIGESFFPLLSEKARNRLNRELEARTPEAPVISVDHRFICPDGRARWIAWTHRGLFDDDGVLTAVQSVGRDITERKSAEAALRKSESKYRGFMENTSDWVWEMDLHGNNVYSNARVESLLGYTVDELPDVSPRQSVHPDDLASIETRLPRLIAEKRGWQDWVLRFRHKNGSYRYLQSTAEPVYDSAGEISGFRGIDRDVTFQTLLADISSSLLRARRESLDGTIEQALGRLAVSYGVDLASLWWFEEQTEKFHFGYGSGRDGVAAPMFDLPLHELLGSWAWRNLLSGESVMFGSLEDLPAEAELERDLFVAQGVEALLVIPLFSDDRLVGASVFAMMRQSREWTETTQHDLRLLCEPLANAVWVARAVSTIERRKQDLSRSERLARVGSFSLSVTSAPGVFPPVGVLEYSKQHYRNLGLKGGQHSVEKIISMLHSDDRGPFLERLRTLLERGSELEHSYRIVRPDGKTRYLASHVEVDRDQDGQVIRLFGSVRDITESVLHEREMRDALTEIEHLRDRLEEENVRLRGEIKAVHGFDAIVGDSPALRLCLDLVRKVAPTDTTVLILGETGTGKELIARTIHELSARRDEHIVAVNCAALPAELVESELFGHEKGAFTGAGSRRPGRFELADGGTLFLDEIGDLPLELQAKLLRAVQQGEFERIGGTETLHVDVRLIAATNRQLKAAVDCGQFRADLYYRLNTFPINVPPLRERSEDIPLLAEHFVRKHSARLGKSIDAISTRMIRYLREQPWPGNVRELESFIERSLISAAGSVLTLGKLDEVGLEVNRLESPAQTAPVTNLRDVERQHIVEVLDGCQWVIGGGEGAAAVLGMPPSTLRSRMKKLGIERTGPVQ